MNLAELEVLLKAEPFRPFAIMTKAGLEIKITDPRLVSLDSDTIKVYRWTHIVNLDAIDHLKLEIRPSP